LKRSTHEDSLDAGSRRPDPNETELNAVRQSLQDQRRATTLLNAEVQKQTEAREAMEAQLIEANAEIAASWDRRKEMTRVIADRDSKLADAMAKLAEANAEAKLNRERRKEAAQLVANRDAEISELRADLQDRYRELATLQRRIARTSLSGWAKRLASPFARLFRRVR